MVLASPVRLFCLTNAITEPTLTAKTTRAMELHQPWSILENLTAMPDRFACRAESTLPKRTSQKNIIIKTDVTETMRRDRTSEVLSEEAAKFLTESDITVIGIDSYGIGNKTTHNILQDKKIGIIEWLNLEQIRPGLYDLTVDPYGEIP